MVYGFGTVNKTSHSYSAGAAQLRGAKPITCSVATCKLKTDSCLLLRSSQTIVEVYPQESEETLRKQLLELGMPADKIYRL